MPKQWNLPTAQMKREKIMTDIPASLVKELRERTGVGMMDCKKALQECNGDMEASVDRLRQKGLSKAARKAGRATSEGVIASYAAPDSSAAALVEVKCETDFVSRGEIFQAFAKNVVKTVYDKKPATNADLAALLGNAVDEQIAALGENMSVGRHANMAVSGFGVIGWYVHSNGKIGVLVEVNCGKAATATNAKFLELARNVAMQIAAASPVALDQAGLDPAVIELERQIYRQNTLDEGRNPAMIDKIVDGRIRKFYQEVCLLEQAYIRDDSMTVTALLAEQGKALGDTLGVAKFVRFQLGEDVPQE